MFRLVKGDSTCIRSGPLSNVISTMHARLFLIKGCEAFLALVLDSKKGQVKLEDIPVVKEFPNVFPKELPSLPPKREVDLSILNTHYKIRLSSFWRRCWGKSVFYANINTKCFFSTSNFFLCLFCVVFEFLVLFVFFLHKFSG